MIADRCSSTDSRVSCVGRHDAGLRGEFRFDFHAKGWTWRAIEDEHRTGFTHCPWCGERLPDIWAVYERLCKGIYEDAD